MKQKNNTRIIAVKLKISKKVVLRTLYENLEKRKLSFRTA